MIAPTSSPMRHAPSLGVDFTQDLAALIRFVARVGVALRMVSPYRRMPSRAAHSARSWVSRMTRAIMAGANSPLTEGEAQDVFWLAECLQNFDYLSSALTSRRLETVIAACENLLQAYEGYARRGLLTAEPDHIPTFRRFNAVFDLRDAIYILRTIHEKALAAQFIGSGR
jgi:hypothetical protein